MSAAERKRRCLRFSQIKPLTSLSGTTTVSPHHYNFPTPPTPVRDMYHNTKFYAPKPIRASEMGFASHHTNSCSSATYSFITERLDHRSSNCHLHLDNAGFPRTIAHVDTTSFTAAPRFYSSAEAGSSTFSSATGQVGYAASDGPGRIESTAFNPCQFRFTIPTIK